MIAMQQGEKGFRIASYIEYCRFADDLVILVDAYPQHDWLLTAVTKRLREELAALQVTINEEKSQHC